VATGKEYGTETEGNCMWGHSGTGGLKRLRGKLREGDYQMRVEIKKA